MNFAERVIASFIERSCKNYVTTIIGVISVALYALTQFSSLIPPRYKSAADAASVLLSGVALILAKDKGIKVNLPDVGKLGVLIFALMLVPALHAQNATNATIPNAPAPQLKDIYGAGLAYSGTTHVAGSAFEAHLLTGNTYTFTDFIAVPSTQTVKTTDSATGAVTASKSLGVSTNIGVGVAQKLVDFGKFPIYTTGTGGISWTGSDTSWQFNYGATSAIHLKGDYYLFPWVGGLSSPTVGGTKIEGGIDFAFGKT